MNWFQKLLCKLFRIGCPQTPPPPPSNGASRGNLLFGYFAGGVVSEFAAHTNILFIGSWGDWTTPAGRQVILANYLSQMQAAVNNGITRVMIVTDWCVFTPGYTLLTVSDAQQYLRVFFNAIQQAGFGNLVYGIYALDEPDIQPLTDAQVVAANATLRGVMNEYTFLAGKPVITTYGDRAGKGGPLPGISSFDWVGFDNYGSPIFTNGEYNSFVARTSPGQRLVVLPGGSGPWYQDPTPFYDKAQSDLRIAMIMPFMWFTNGDTIGIADNATRPTYVTLGTKVKAANP